MMAAPGVGAAPAQYAFRVSFTDKQGAPQLSASPAWLNARSVARRNNFGIALDSTDRPVSPLYIDTVLQLTGGVFHNASRWLNQCVVLLTDSSKILQLAGKPYIRNVSWVGYFPNGLHMKVVKADNPKFAAERASMSHAKITGSASYYGYSYPQTSMVNGDFLHDLGLRGNGKLIAILDEGFSGVDTHPGFDSLRAEGRLLETFNFKTNTPGVYLNGNHGTSCLSTMAGLYPGSYIGSAPRAQYALYSTEDGNFTDALYELDNLIAGMERADSIGADVISASIVYNIFTSPVNSIFSKSELDGHSTNVARAANLAVAKGIFYVSSAGNEGGNFWDYLDSPGDADSVLTIGSVNTLRLVSGFSSPGPSASGRVKPDVCMPGDPATVFTGSSSIVNSSGTSFAAPQAAGYVACLLEAYPKATPYQIRQAIVRSADSFSTPSARRGYGVPNFSKVHQALNVDSHTSYSPLTVLPNPFTSTFNVLLPASAASVELYLTDISGRKFGAKTFRSGNSITVRPPSALPAGVYFLHAVIDGRLYHVKLLHN